MSFFTVTTARGAK